MKYNFIENLNETTSPESLLSMHFKYKENIYLISQIIGIGGFKVIYELLDIKLNQVTHVLKVFRLKISEKRIDELKEVADHFIDRKLIKDHEYIYINNWPVLFESHYNLSESETIWVGSNTPIKTQYKNENEDKIMLMLENGNEKDALELCEKMQEKHPLTPWYHAIKSEIMRNAAINWHYSASLFLFNHVDNYNKEQEYYAHDKYSGKDIKLPKGDIHKVLGKHVLVAFEYLTKAEQALAFLYEVDMENEYYDKVNNTFKDLRARLNKDVENNANKLLNA